MLFNAGLAICAILSFKVYTSPKVKPEDGSVIYIPYGPATRWDPVHKVLWYDPFSYSLIQVTLQGTQSVRSLYVHETVRPSPGSNTELEVGLVMEVILQSGI